MAAAFVALLPGSVAIVSLATLCGCATRGSRREDSARTARPPPFWRQVRRQQRRQQWVPLPQAKRARRASRGAPAFWPALRRRTPEAGHRPALRRAPVRESWPKTSRRRRISRSAGILAGFAPSHIQSRSQTGAPACPRRAGFPAGRFTGLSGPVFVQGAGKPPEPAGRNACPTSPAVPRSSLPAHAVQLIGAIPATLTIQARVSRRLVEGCGGAKAPFFAWKGGGRAFSRFRPLWRIPSATRRIQSAARRNPSASRRDPSASRRTPPAPLRRPSAGARKPSGPRRTPYAIGGFHPQAGGFRPRVGGSFPRPGGCPVPPADSVRRPADDARKPADGVRKPAEVGRQGAEDCRRLAPDRRRVPPDGRAVAEGALPTAEDRRTRAPAARTPPEIARRRAPPPVGLRAGNFLTLARRAVKRCPSRRQCQWNFGHDPAGSVSARW